ncbi:MAG: response regulator, partial [Spongiibacteraceae bacterium]|nr:response regulator [Spongiibacteraceae bacterium]
MAQILIVDDSASMRNMVAATLQSVGHTIVDAPDGQVALTKAKAGKFDAIVTDLNMPVMDG